VYAHKDLLEEVVDQRLVTHSSADKTEQVGM
jgi:hypothetical protein